MLNLQLTDEQLAVRELTRELGLNVLAPAAREAEADGDVPAHVWKTLLDTGLTSPLVELHGGGGIPDAVTHVVAAEGLAYGDPGIAAAAVWSGAAATIAGLCGTDAQSAAAAEHASDPDRRGSVALYEGFGRSPRQLATTIAATGDGTWRVSGRKVGVAFAAAADPIVVVGVDPTDGRLRAAAIGHHPDGVHIESSAGGLALDAAATATVTFDATIADSDLVGGAQADQAVLLAAVQRIRLSTAAVAIGTASRAIDYAAQYANERVAFGRPIAAFQGVSFPLAEAFTRIAAARFEIVAAAEQLDRDTAGEHDERVTRAVNYASVVATETTRDALQTLGGHGFITDHPVEMWYRSAAALAALDFDPLCSAFEPAL